MLFDPVHLLIQSKLEKIVDTLNCLDAVALRITAHLAPCHECNMFGYTWTNQFIIFFPVHPVNLHSNRPHARASSTMGDAEGLVQVEMRNIRAIISRATQTHLENRKRGNN